MTDLHVVATIAVKPGAEDEVREALTVLTQETRKEEGNISYDLYESQAAPGTFVTVEVWTGQEALDAHMQSAHVQSALGGLGDKLAGAPGIHPLTAIV